MKKYSLLLLLFFVPALYANNIDILQEEVKKSDVKEVSELLEKMELSGGDLLQLKVLAEKVSRQRKFYFDDPKFDFKQEFSRVLAYYTVALGLVFSTMNIMDWVIKGYFSDINDRFCLASLLCSASSIFSSKYFQMRREEKKRDLMKQCDDATRICQLISSLA